MRRSLARALFASALIVSSSVAAKADGGDRWAGAPMGTRERESWLEHRIEQKISEGQLDGWHGRDVLRKLDDIKRMDAAYRDYDGHLNEDQRRDILARLNAVRGEMGD